jgi:4,5-dihydroxyphthalate decarboxylase
MMAAGEIQAGFTGAAGIGRAGPPVGGWEKGGQTPEQVYPELIGDAPQAEAEWFRRTGIYPIHGAVVIKTDVLSRHPWVARALYEAFVSAKALYIAHLTSGSTTWPEDGRYRSLMSLVGDPLPYGLSANRPSIEAMLAYGLQQGLIPRSMSFDEAFVDPDKL